MQVPSRWKEPLNSRLAHKAGQIAAPSRDLFGRVLRDYPHFDEYDLALYVDGFLASEQGKEDEALDRFDRLLSGYPLSRFVPDAHMFKLALDVLKRNPQEIAFVDDRAGNVDAAKAAGMRGIRYEGSDSLKREVEALGIKL